MKRLPSGFLLLPVGDGLVTDCLSSISASLLSIPAMADSKCSAVRDPVDCSPSAVTLVRVLVGVELGRPRKYPPMAAPNISIVAVND